MIKKFIIYIKLQYKLFFVLLCIAVLPAYLTFHYLPSIANTQYIYLTFLAALKLFFYQDGPYKESLKKTIRPMLEKELKKSPSTNQIIARIEDCLNARDIALAFNAIIIVFMALFFGKF